MRFLIFIAIFFIFQINHATCGMNVINNDSSSQEDNLSCSICKESADYVHENPFASLDDVKSAMSQRCRRYNQYADVCQNTLDTFLPQIYQQAHDPLLTSNAVCIRIGLCPNKGSANTH